MTDTERIAVVTRVARGIGAGIAKCLSEEGNAGVLRDNLLFKMSEYDRETGDGFRGSSMRRLPGRPGWPSRRHRAGCQLLRRRVSGFVTGRVVYAAEGPRG